MMARPSLSTAPLASNMTGRAHELLNESISKEIELKKSFLAVLQNDGIMEAIENSDTFADLLRYALLRGLVSQKALAERLRYANSQVGRWASGKAAPQYLVRERVIDEMRKMLTETLSGQAGSGAAAMEANASP